MHPVDANGANVFMEKSEPLPVKIRQEASKTWHVNTLSLTPHVSVSPAGVAGGSQTLNSMFRYPDVFHTGIAIAFVADQRLYDTVYQERYMNTPQNNPEGLPQRVSHLVCSRIERQLAVNSRYRR
mgnify:CR=1 FL=1